MSNEQWAISNEQWAMSNEQLAINNEQLFFRQPENEPYFDAVKIFICKANKGLRSNQGEVRASRKAKLKIYRSVILKINPFCLTRQNIKPIANFSLLIAHCNYTFTSVCISFIIQAAWKCRVFVCNFFKLCGNFVLKNFAVYWATVLWCFWLWWCLVLCRLWFTRA